jgi:DNA-binding MarR family transcriptional regulator
MSSASGVASGPTPVGTAVQEIEAELLVLLARVRRRSRDAARRVHPELTAVGYAVLLRVYREDATRAADLVTGLDLDKGLVSRAVSQLERLGLVERAADPADARAQRISVTAAGRRAVEETIAAGRANLQQSLAGWAPGEVASFADQLHRYNEALGS